jgi:hypothetical protein
MIAVITHTTTVTSHAIRISGTRLFSRSAMTTALTPDLALAYLGELSSEIEASVLLDGDGKLLAGDEALSDAARALLDAAPDAPAVEVLTARGGVFAARSSRHAIVAVARRSALPALVRYDLGLVLGDLDDG